MSPVAEFLGAWSEAFVAAEAEGSEVELFAAVIGASVPVRPGLACSSCWRGGPEFVAGELRYVPRWSAYVVLCGPCAERFEAR